MSVLSVATAATCLALATLCTVLAWSAVHATRALHQLKES